MGYSTDFSGSFKLDRPLKPEHKAYLEAFSGSRRMKRNAKKAEKLSDSVRIAAGLPIGIQGEYFVGNAECYFGQDNDESVVEYNDPPDTQPSLWCQWIPSEDGESIEWDGSEKFYSYIEWIKYIITNFLKPWKYKLNGSVKWQGEEMNDRGIITVKNNVMKTKELE